jgi:hypothetical protein
MASPRDDFERYYTEKLWAWVPEVYRDADDADVLRSLIALVAPSVAAARRSTDRLWEDQFAEFADDWALPYIGELVGTRLVSALNRRGRRADIANTIHYRRRKGTLPLMEQLVRDIAQWDGVVVEAFRRLARAPHRLDAPLAGAGHAPPGPISGTPPGGAADLRAALLPEDPWDEFAHAPDVRTLRGHLGRHGIAKLNFHLFRHVAWPLRAVTPYDFGGQCFSLDPSGRDRALYRPGQRLGEDCERRVQWQVVAPLTCRLLAQADYLLTRTAIPPALLASLAPLVDQRVHGEPRMRQTLHAQLQPQANFDAHVYDLLATGITPDSPRANLIPGAVAITIGLDIGAAPVTQERLLPAQLGDWGAALAPAGHSAALDPALGRLRVFGALGAARVFLPGHSIGALMPVGAGSYSRVDAVTPGGVVVPDGGAAQPGPVGGFALATTGVQQFGSSKTYEPTAPAANNLSGVRQLVLQAADRQRPYVRLVPGGGGTTWTITAAPKPLGGDPQAPANRRTLVVEGLWLGLRPSGLAAQAVAGADMAATPVETALVIDGVWDQVLIRHCTLDPGGETARTSPTQAMPIPLLRLDIVGEVEELRIEQSIVGPIDEVTASADACSAARIVLVDSVVQSLVAARPAIRTHTAAVDLTRCTVFGDVQVDRLEASETLIQGRVQVQDNQHGCFRFSACNDAPATMLPRQFESHLIAPSVPNHAFVSRRYGDAGYAQLSTTAPPALLTGAENGSEIGATSSLLLPIRQQDLSAKVAEFMPFGLVAQFIVET